MKILFILLLMAGYCHAQTPNGIKSKREKVIAEEAWNVVKFKIGKEVVDEAWTTESPAPMPNARPSNSFYRDPRDSPNVMRATLDNMPIHVPDTSVSYTIMQSKQRYRMPMPRPDAPQKKR